MSEENEIAKEAVAEADKVAEEVTGEEYSEAEQTAIEHGWTPEGVEGKLNLSAEEFNDRQSLYDDIRGLKKQNRKLQDGMSAMKDFQGTIRENERGRVVAELNEAKKKALSDENYDAVVAIDDRIAHERQPAPPQSNDVFETWVDNNDWYGQNAEMKDHADLIGDGYSRKHPEKNLSDVYEWVTTEVKKRFPEKFGNQERSKPNSVEGAGKGRASSSKKHSERDLPEDARDMMKTIVRTGTMTKEEYLKGYFG